ncbi:hypothetical protein ASC95_09640 [Pelomonas sp. Root1217]|uniref:hypothetical protein n=1 Tax=Pelomonas sp. Root1217 TaxID=1736430 RepID=UPI00070CE985|nr:hypothetical protein [Pelomonas sp. Root1217]KQV53023.1 hypothetical protein ASC95_09640 [Pelomonas sp. Root1217]
MNTASYNQLLLAFWRERDRDAPWGRHALFGITVLGLALGLYLVPQMAQLLLAASAALTLMSLWMAVVGSLLRQNHPHAARFVPGHLRRMVASAVAAWGLLSLASAVLLWLCLPSLPSLPVLLLGAAALLAFLGWALREWQLWLLVSIGPVLFFGAGLDRKLAPLGAALRELWFAQPLPVLALSLLALGWSVARLFGSGDAAHRDAYARFDRMRRAAEDSMRGKYAGTAAFGRVGEWMGRPFELAVSGWQHHAVTRAEPTLKSVMRRAEIVLHGRQHWLYQGLGTLLALGIAVLSFTLAFALAGQGLQDNWTKGAYGMAIGLASMGFNPSFGLPSMLWHSRREQALMRLLPGMPQGATLNRAVAWMQLRHALCAFALTTAGLAWLAWAAGEPALVSFAFGALPLCTGWVLRAPTRIKAPTAGATFMPVLAFILMGWGMYTLNQVLHTPLAMLAGLSIAVSAALGAWRWRALTIAPTALPAGRQA